MELLYPNSWNPIELHFVLAHLALCESVASPGHRTVVVGSRPESIDSLFRQIRVCIAESPTFQKALGIDCKLPHRIGFTNESQIWGVALGGLSLCGCSADLLILLNSEEFTSEQIAAVKPLMRRDRYRQNPPKVYAGDLDGRLLCYGRVDEGCVTTTRCSRTPRIGRPMRPETQTVLYDLEELIHEMRQDAEDWEIGANQGVISLEAGFALNGWACFLEEFVAKQREEERRLAQVPDTTVLPGPSEEAI